MFQRLLNNSFSNSFFIFGARGTGKSTLIQQVFGDKKILYFDLLDPEIEDRFARKPKLLEDQILAQMAGLEWVIIDEVQRVPKLLNLVHRLVEKTPIKFVMTGSSARKLKRGAANLLAGRAFVYKLFPLTTWEMGEQFNLMDYLSWGSLPKVLGYSSFSDKMAYLKAYALTYLKEEIQAEQIVRQLDPFREFLEMAALSNGTILNCNKIACDVGCDPKTVKSYFQILEDTWLGFHLPAFHRSLRKGQKLHPKFYFFDPGVKRALERSLDTTLIPQTSAFGDAFEHGLILEFYRLNEYLQKDYGLSYFQSYHGSEIDLILQKPKSPLVMVEIKSTEKVNEVEVKKMERLSKELNPEKLYYLSRDSHPQQIGSVRCLPWQQGLKEIFGVNKDLASSF